VGVEPEVGGEGGAGFDVEEPPPPPPHPIPAARTARMVRLRKLRHFRRRAGIPSRKTQASVRPPLAANHLIGWAEEPAALTALAGVDALMVSVAVVFPFTVSDAGFKLQVNPLGAVQASPTDALKPLIEPRLRTAVPVAPAVTLTTGVCTTIEKSVKGLLSDKPN
jgi:hypothetical protein